MITVCLDASFVVSMQSPDGFTEQADGLWRMWIESEARIIAPPIILSEVTSVLRNHVYRGILPADEGELAFRRFLEMPIEIVQPPDLSERAWRLARDFNRPNAYDAFYVALAQTEDCDLWTCDRRMFNSFRLPNMRLLGEETSL